MTQINADGTDRGDLDNARAYFTFVTFGPSSRVGTKCRGAVDEAPRILAIDASETSSPRRSSRRRCFSSLSYAILSRELSLNRRERVGAPSPCKSHLGRIYS